MEQCYHTDCNTESGIPKSLRSHMWGKGGMTLEQVIELSKAIHPKMTNKDVIGVMLSDIQCDWLKSRQLKSLSGEGWAFFVEVVLTPYV